MFFLLRGTQMSYTWITHVNVTQYVCGILNSKCDHVTTCVATFGRRDDSCPLQHIAFDIQQATIDRQIDGPLYRSPLEAPVNFKLLVGV